MGYTAWSSNTYDTLKSTYVGKDTDDIFTSNKTRKVSDGMNPYGLKFRESRDSDAHPNSLAVAIFLDETGSMGSIPDLIVRDKLNHLMDTLINNGVQDAHVLFGGVGDTQSDKYPLQVGQFEAGTEELNKWLTEIYLEGNGGGQNMESYLLAWLIAGRHTSIDCFEKRGRKGFLFTIGDEKSWNKISADRLKELLGYEQAEEVTDVQLLQEAQRMYHVFHIHVNQTGYKDDPNVIGYWKKMLGERAIVLDDYNTICEVIASTVAVISGADLDSVVSNFDKSTALIVRNSIATAVNSVSNVGKGSVVTL
jgi:hypothetical protein